jgi:hypothetical protein
MLTKDNIKLFTYVGLRQICSYNRDVLTCSFNYPKDYIIKMIEEQLHYGHKIFIPPYVFNPDYNYVKKIYKNYKSILLYDQQLL